MTDDQATVAAARWRLARFIYERLERADPRGGPWDELSDYEKGTYHEVVLDLVDAPDLLSAALGRADDDLS